VTLPSMTLPPAHPPVKAQKTGVLLVNLGSPDAPTTSAVRRYLKEFLSDRRVIELTPLLWQPILRGIILNVRPSKSAKKYASVWGDAAQPAPLVRITAAQTAALKNSFGANVIVDFAMRYGNPAIAARLDYMQKEMGCTRILVVPLYPQYSAATTATVVDEVNRWLARQRWQPTVRFLPPYFDDPDYIAAIAGSISTHLASLDWQPDVILASFHGMPRETLDKGDPYHCQSQKTARLVREALGETAERMQITFQSRFGPKEWLQPYTDGTVSALAQKGVKKLALVSPGFAADCLETLEEIQEEVAETFSHNGGEKFTYVPCLNDSPAGVALLEKLVRKELQGWII
jgi:protoporphyrin/coproporphyrin ferrochelatase